MALEQMEGFELAGRTVRNFVYSYPCNRSQVPPSSVLTPFMKRVLSSTRSRIRLTRPAVIIKYYISSTASDLVFTGGNLNAASRQALMQKLARIDQPPARQQTVYVCSDLLCLRCSSRMRQSETKYPSCNAIQVSSAQEYV